MRANLITPTARICLLSFLITTVSCGAGTLPPGAPAGDRSVLYEKVDLYVQEQGKAEDYDVRLIFDPHARTLRVAGETDATVSYATIPYDAITSVTYSNTKSPRWKSGAGVALAAGIFALPVFFMKGKKHWMTVTFNNVPDHPEGALLFKLDKNNFTPIIGTMESQAGVKVERIVED